MAGSPAAITDGISTPGGGVAVHHSPSQPELTRCDTAAYQVVEKFGYLWLSERDTPVSTFPLTRWDGFDLAGSFSTLFQAPLHVALDNFSEDEHFPFVHFFLGWDEHGLSQLEFKAQNYDDRTEVLYRGPQRPSVWLPLLGARSGLSFRMNGSRASILCARCSLFTGSIRRPAWNDRW